MSMATMQQLQFCSILYRVLQSIKENEISDNLVSVNCVIKMFLTKIK